MDLLRVVAGVLRYQLDYYTPVITVLVVRPRVPELLDRQLNPLAGQRMQVFVKTLGLVEQEFAIV